MMPTRTLPGMSSPSCALPARPIRSLDQELGLGAVPGLHGLGIPVDLAIQPQSQVENEHRFGQRSGETLEATERLGRAAAGPEPLLMMALLGSAGEEGPGRLRVAEALPGQQGPVAARPFDGVERALRADDDGPV